MVNMGLNQVNSLNNMVLAQVSSLDLDNMGLAQANPLALNNMSLDQVNPLANIGPAHVSPPDNKDMDQVSLAMVNMGLALVSLAMANMGADQVSLVANMGLA